MSDKGTLAGFDNLSTDDLLDSLTDDSASDTTPAEPAKPADKPADVPADPNKLDDEPAKPAEKPADKPVSDSKKPAEPATEGDGDKPLTLDDDDTTPPAADEETSTTWMELSKDLGVDIKEDSYEEFKSKLMEKIEVSMEKFKPETQQVIKFTEAGGSVEDFIEPLSKYDRLIYMNDADLLTLHFKNKGIDEDGIQRKIDELVALENVESTAKALRDGLMELREQTKQTIIQNKVTSHEAYQEKLKTAFTKEAEFVNSKLKERKDLLGTPLADKNREKVYMKYKTGGYEEDFKNPEFIADFLLYREYGKRAQENLRTIIRKEVEKEYLADRHNVPPKNKNAAGNVRSTPSGHAPEGNWDALEAEKVA